MKSFQEILDRLTGLFHSGENVEALGGVPMHSLGSSKRHNKNRKPNAFRRAHKPVYGGWPHKLTLIGQIPALTMDQVKRLEKIIGQRLMITFQGVHSVKKIVSLNRFGKPKNCVRKPGEVLMTLDEAQKALKGAA